MPHYLGHVYVDKKLEKWIDSHSDFASPRWISGEVVYSPWEKRGNNCQVIADVISGSERLKIRILFTHYPLGGPEYSTDYVHVYGAHTLGSKKKHR